MLAKAHAVGFAAAPVRSLSSHQSPRKATGSRIIAGGRRGSPSLAQTSRPGRIGSVGINRRGLGLKVRASAAQEQGAASGTGYDEEYDIVVIGSGVGGLTAGAMLARYGKTVKVVEAHYAPGGCCHMFRHIQKDVGVYEFEVGPSIWEGLDRPCDNPLRMVLDVLEEEVPVKAYDGWSMWTEEGHWRYKFGPIDEPGGVIEMLADNATDPKAAVKEWNELQDSLQVLSEANDACPLLHLRQDAGILLSTMSAVPFYATHPKALPLVPALFDSFHKMVDPIVKEPFLRRWLDALSFFSGFPAKGTMSAAMIYCLTIFHKPDATLSAPTGGTAAVVDALVRALKKFGGKLQLKSPVEEIEVKGGRAEGVRLRNGKKIRAKECVVSNATLWNTLKLLPNDEKLAAEGAADVSAWRDSMEQTPTHGSIMHLFLGVKSEGLPPLDSSHLVINDWSRPLGDPQNVVTIFIPTVLDPGVAPEGRHIIHVYTAGSEPYDLWKDFERGSPEYEAFKEERSQILWQAIERVIPDIRDRVEFQNLASPLTHEAFLFRHQGTYGPACAAGSKELAPGIELPSVPFPGFKTPLPGLMRCGDSTFPGIGVPAAAASGAICANTLVPVWQHIGMLIEHYAFRRKWAAENPNYRGDVYSPPPSEWSPAGGGAELMPRTSKPDGEENNASSPIQVPGTTA